MLFYQIHIEKIGKPRKGLPIAVFLRGYAMKGSLHLALIDDDPGVLRGLELLLQVSGYTVSPFVSAESAFAYLLSARGRQNVQVILADQRMPGMSGEDLLSRLNEHSCTIPFILMSGHADAEDFARILSQGAIAFLQKPFSPQSLKDILERHWEGVRRPGAPNLRVGSNSEHPKYQEINQEKRFSASAGLRGR
jgi:FixJ family two-component response regulator